MITRSLNLRRLGLAAVLVSRDEKCVGWLLKLSFTKADVYSVIVHPRIERIEPIEFNIRHSKKRPRILIPRTDGITTTL